MGDQVEDAGKHLDVASIIGILLIDDQVKVSDGIVVVATTKIQAGDAVIEHQNTVMIPVVSLVFNDLHQFWDQCDAFGESPFDEMLLDGVNVFEQREQSFDVVVIGHVKPLREAHQIIKNFGITFVMQHVVQRAQQIMQTFEV